MSSAPSPAQEDRKLQNVPTLLSSLSDPSSWRSSSMALRGTVSHVGTFPDLEDQMCNFTASG
jgi:phage terminase large subunit-like protein